MHKPGLKLYDILPEYIRQKDENGHTRGFLAAADSLLERLHATLQQYYADNFPNNFTNNHTHNLSNNDTNNLKAQDWLLPYFADLLDARLVSPLTEGKRDEVQHAVRWRQRKGTRTVVDEVTESVGQWESVVQEGWQRIAQTPRLDTPLLPEDYYGLDDELDTQIPAEMAKHPGLPAATIDFRIGSRAVEDEDNHPNSQVSTLQGKPIRWRQQYPHGVPCHHQRIGLNGEYNSSAFDDVSKRTPDLRTTHWQVGHIHPRKVLIYVAQPEGFFPTHRPKVQWRQQWLDENTLPSEHFLEWVTIYSRLDRTLVFENRPVFENRSTTFFPVEIRGIFKLGQVPETGVGSPDAGAYHFEGLVLNNSVEVDSGQATLNRCAVRHLAVHSRFEGGDPRHLKVPVINASNTLFQSIQSATSLTRLEYCTVTKSCITESIQASDCIFTCLIQKDHGHLDPPEQYCIRYSKITMAQTPNQLESNFQNTRDALWFFGQAFADPGFGVLHPATEDAIRYGAEDGTEMGAYHFLQLSLKFEAVKDKLIDFLPVGYEAVVIPDQHFNHLNSKT